MDLHPGTPYEVRCPLHRSIPFDESERAVIDHPYFQRLRAISQLGFAHLVYPGATHTRFSHALGVMHLAGRIFDRISAGSPHLFATEFDPETLAYCRRIVRLAGLLHDLGHLPFSHAFEPLLPAVEKLELPRKWFSRMDGNRQARHEDYSVAIVRALAADSQALFSEEEAQDISALIHDEVLPTPRLTGGNAGQSLYPLLKQIISGEIDADRMDYLRRDAHFAGVTYGNFDLDRLIQGLSCIPTTDGIALALDYNALFTYENYLMARFHMAMQVYFHQTLLPFDYFLHQAVKEGEIVIPLDGGLESVLDAREDVVLSKLYSARDKRWCSRIVRRRPAARLYRLDGDWDEGKKRRILEALIREGIDPIFIREERRLSNLGAGGEPDVPPIMVVESVLGVQRPRPLHEVSRLLKQYNQPFLIERLYCDPEQLESAVAVLHRELQAE